MFMLRKEKGDTEVSPFCCQDRQSGLLSHLSKALAAINRTVRLGLKGNPGLAAAGSAGSSEELTGTTGRILAGIAACLAALGLILEAALCVELLLTGGKNKFLAAFFAY